jgi:hypothetical protein
MLDVLQPGSDAAAASTKAALILGLILNEMRFISCLRVGWPGMMTRKASEAIGAPECFPSAESGQIREIIQGRATTPRGGRPACVSERENAREPHGSRAFFVVAGARYDLVETFRADIRWAA